MDLTIPVFRGVPHTRSGFIDIAELCRILEKERRVGNPGQFYSYGNAGAGLLAALLESVYSLPYADLLRQNLPLHRDFLAHESPNVKPRICPATGGAFRLMMDDLLTILDQQIQDGNIRPGLAGAQAAMSDVQPLPGWHPSEVGISLGWKCYAEGWIGHNSELAGAALLVRIHPKHRVGVAVASSGPSTTTIANALFGECLPGIASLKTPRMSGVSNVDPQRRQRFSGTYSNANYSISIQATPEATLRMALIPATYAGGRVVPFDARLLPAQNDVFLLYGQGPSAPDFQYIQFLPGGTPCAERLWNGANVFTRV